MLDLDDFFERPDDFPEGEVEEGDSKTRFKSRKELVSRFYRMCIALDQYVLTLSLSQKESRGILNQEDAEDFKKRIWDWWAEMHITSEYPRCYDFTCGHNVTNGVLEYSAKTGEKPILNRIGFCTCQEQYENCNKRIPERNKYFEAGKPF